MMAQRTNLFSFLVSCAALALSSCASAEDKRASKLAKVPHDHTIYLLSGDLEALEKFEAEIGSNWQGGTIIERDADTRQFKYWAFSERTAPQSRSFMMPAAFSGLTLDFESYDEASAFPEYRDALDQIALGCELAIDPFFLSPVATITLIPHADVDPAKFGCAFQGVRENEMLSQLQIGFIGNEKAPSEETE